MLEKYYNREIKRLENLLKLNNFPKQLSRNIINFFLNEEKNYDDGEDYDLVLSKNSNKNILIITSWDINNKASVISLDDKYYLFFNHNNKTTELIYEAYLNVIIAFDDLTDNERNIKGIIE